MPGVGVEKSERLQRRIDYVARRVEDREAAAVGQHPRRATRSQRRREHVVFGPDLDEGLGQAGTGGGTWHPPRQNARQRPGPPSPTLPPPLLSPPSRPLAPPLPPPHP